MLALLRLRNSFSKTIPIFLSTSKKVSSKKLLLPNLSYTENLVIMIPYVSKAKPSIFCEFILVHRIKKCYFNIDVEILAFISPLNSINAMIFFRLVSLKLHWQRNIRDIMQSLSNSYH